VYLRFVEDRCKKGNKTAVWGWRELR